MNQSNIVLNLFEVLKKSKENSIISQETYNQVIKTANMFIADNKNKELKNER